MVHSQICKTIARPIVKLGGCTITTPDMAQMNLWALHHLAVNLVGFFQGVKNHEFSDDGTLKKEPK